MAIINIPTTLIPGVFGYFYLKFPNITNVLEDFQSRLSYVGNNKWQLNISTSPIPAATHEEFVKAIHCKKLNYDSFILNNPVTSINAFKHVNFKVITAPNSTHEYVNATNSLSINYKTSAGVRMKEIFGKKFVTQPYTTHDYQNFTSEFIPFKASNNDIYLMSVTLTSFCDEAVCINPSGGFVRVPFANLQPVKGLKAIDLDNVWLPTSTITPNFLDHLREQIRVRYGFFERPTNGLSNIILDSFFPRLLYQHRLNIQQLATAESFPATAVAISPLVAEVLQVRKIPTEQLCLALGYTAHNIKALLATVKQKNLNMIFAGVGGTGMNTAYWLTELCQLTHTFNLFNLVAAYEKETIELSNMLRFPISLAAYSRPGQAGKLNIALPFFKQLSRRQPICEPYYLNNHAIRYESNTLFQNGHITADTFIYGAPSLEVRNELSGIGNFICATHANVSCSIWLNPRQDEQIQVESYGMIQLGVFFMNQLRMAIGLLELLASDTPLNTPDHQVLRYTFDGTIQKPTDRVYHWQINPDLLMMDETQAAVAA